ncbi:thioredoxin domain-containing protein 5-like [Convolutriloba macropyga]|uniref:thioredoxin domain-containing protein 5-like n=1 Tax=Convolutriloba macropyga TaxID=536237 RepID=UPI003F51F0F5
MLYITNKTVALSLCLFYNLLFCVFNFVHSEPEVDGLDKCEVLDEANLEESVESSSYFVMFYAPWCGHCKRLKPKWNNFCSKHNIEGTLMKIGVVDCTVEQYTCKKHGVSGFPTLKFYKKGKPDGIKYAGSREVEAFEKFAAGILDPDSVEPEKPVEPCELPRADNGLLELKECNFAQGVGSGHSLIKFYAPWCGHCKRMAPAWAELASNLASVESVHIGKLDCTVYRSVCNKYDVHGFPTIKYIKDGKEVEKYIGGRDVTSLTNYLNNKVNGTEIPSKTPEAERGCSKVSPTKHGMWEAVDCNFKHHISHADVFVMFYAPWCGHCKKLMPTWEKLAENYLHYVSIRITRIDCTNNKESCAKYKVKGFPTLMYFRKGKDIGGYAGARDYESLRDYVENKLIQIVLPERGPNQGMKELPRKVGTLDSVTQLEALRKDIRHSFAVIYYHASNDDHMKDREVFHDFKDRVTKGVDIMEVDCGVAETLCKDQKAFSDDETFLYFYMGTKVYKMDSNTAKTTENMRDFINDSMKQSIIFMRDEL